MITIYDSKRIATGDLENAFDIEETVIMNGVSRFEFKLPISDPKNFLCEPMTVINYNGGPLYRIMPIYKIITENGYVHYECEHVISLLINDLLFGYHSIGGTGTANNTSNAINWLLQRQNMVYNPWGGPAIWQTDNLKRINWQLGVCEVNRNFSYSFEQTQLLNALWQIFYPVLDDVMFEYNTDSFPYTLNVRRLINDPNQAIPIKIGTNALQIRHQSDPSSLCTRLFPLGQGEEINQVNIRSVNNNIPFIESPANIVNEYGIIEQPYVDRSYETPQQLFDGAVKALRILEKPYIEYELDFIRLEGHESFTPTLGGQVRTEDNEVYWITQINYRHEELYPTRLILSTHSNRIDESIINALNRQKIEMSSPQGSTNLFSESENGNCDFDNPLTMVLIIPPGLNIINYVELDVDLRNFRLDTLATEGGGAVTISSPASETFTMPLSPTRWFQQSVRQTSAISDKKVFDQSTDRTMDYLNDLERFFGLLPTERENFGRIIRNNVITNTSGESSRTLTGTMVDVNNANIIVNTMYPSRTRQFKYYEEDFGQMMRGPNNNEIFTNSRDAVPNVTATLSESNTDRDSNFPDRTIRIMRENPEVYMVDGNHFAEWTRPSDFMLSDAINYDNEEIFTGMPNRPQVVGNPGYTAILSETNIEMLNSNGTVRSGQNTLSHNSTMPHPSFLRIINGLPTSIPAIDFASTGYSTPLSGTTSFAGGNWSLSEGIWLEHTHQEFTNHPRVLTPHNHQAGHMHIIGVNNNWVNHTHNMSHRHRMPHTHDIRHRHPMGHTHEMAHVHPMSHTHYMNHTHDLRHRHYTAHTHPLDHVHDMQHVHEIEHTHNMDHRHLMPHDHDIVHVHEMAHTHNMRHRHGMLHNHGMDHYHEMQHDHNMYHTHDMRHNHVFTLNDHIHTMVPNMNTIWTMATRFDIIINGQVRRTITGRSSNLDITDWLVNNLGLLPRGGRHTIQIRPDLPCHARMLASIRGHVNSRGDRTL